MNLTFLSIDGNFDDVTVMSPVFGPNSGKGNNNTNSNNNNKNDDATFGQGVGAGIGISVGIAVLGFVVVTFFRIRPAAANRIPIDEEDFVGHRA